MVIICCFVFYVGLLTSHYVNHEGMLHIKRFFQEQACQNRQNEFIEIFYGLYHLTRKYIEKGLKSQKREST